MADSHSQTINYTTIPMVNNFFIFETYQSPERFCYNGMDTPPDSPTSIMATEDGKEISSIRVAVTYKDGSTTVTGYTPNVTSHNPTIDHHIFDTRRNDQNATKPTEYCDDSGKDSKSANNNTYIGGEDSFTHHKEAKKEKMVFEMKEIQEFPQESSFLAEEGIWVVQKNTDREGLFHVGSAESENFRNGKLSPYDISAQYKKDLICHGGDVAATKIDGITVDQTEPLCLRKKRPESMYSVPIERDSQYYDYSTKKIGNGPNTHHTDVMKLPLDTKDQIMSNPSTAAQINQSRQNRQVFCSSTTASYKPVEHVSQYVDGNVSLQAVEETVPPTQQYESVMVATKCGPNAFPHIEDAIKGEQGSNVYTNGTSKGFIPMPKAHDFNNLAQCGDSQQPYQLNQFSSNDFQPRNLNLKKT